MKFQYLAFSLAALAIASQAQAEVKINVANGAGKQLTVQQSPLTTGSDNVYDNLTIVLDSNGDGKFAQAAEPVVINISEGTDPIATKVFSAAGSENILLNADGLGDYVATGTPLMEGVTKVNQLLSPYMKRFQSLAEFYNINPEVASAQIDSLSEEINNALVDYVKANPNSPEAPYALIMVDGQPFIDTYPLLTEVSRKSILMPSVEQKKQDEEKSIAQQKRIAQLESGVAAPAFTLPDLEGKQVSLSDFKGKWVILDFWGSWCRWCVKGFPELKELSQKYGDKLAVVGIDCRDSQERWRDAVKKYELTWVNLYNDCSQDNNPLLETYVVQGFPTKVIVDPNGIIKKIVVGADPAFPEILAGFIGE